ncbi:MAG: dipeptide/oligopeptide/nickel ABC transporter permease/ATP-binding protein, partial [Acidimicrobiaceae bacterium]|nr:dipeptide/oligopeptide/nickel ABC transporter permease/ATP-binding protein [Acidimicrobiaceae bacterium]
MAGLAWIVLLLLMAAFPGVIAPKSPTAQDFTYRHINEVPSGTYWLGTDQFGRDLFARVVWGSRYALESIVIGLGVATLLGIPIGMIAGWRGGRFDRVVVWLIDVLFSLPLILVAMAIVAATGQGIVPAMLVVGFLTSTRFARMARGITLGEREQLYVDSARITGLSTSTILRRYILPNLLPDLMVGFAIVAGAVLLTSAVLSFLGAGAPYDSPDWGAMLNQSQPLFLKDPWGVVPPSAMIVLTVLAFNLLGDGIRDAIGRDASHNAMTRSKRKVVASAVTPHAEDAILSIRDLSVVFPEPGRPFEEADQVLDGVSLDVRPGETLGIVGESGSGKSMTVLSALGLVPAPGVCTQGSVRFDGRDVTDLPERDWQHIRGKEIGVIFQEPIAVLNPALTIGAHLCEPLQLHLGLNRKQARERAGELLRRVRVPDPIRRLDEYPHQMSGGMAQRVGIAMALACEPKLLIADEPTTALDVTVQGQILDLLASLTDEAGMAMIIITHDMGVVAEVADRVAVLYGGQVVEVGSSQEIFSQPRHPYTAALLDTMPQNNEGAEYLRVIPGMVPSSS